VSKNSQVQKKKILSDFAAKVRNRRNALGLTQEELAEKANCHVNYIGGIERATRNPSLTIIISIAKALEVPSKELMPN